MLTFNDFLRWEEEDKKTVKVKCMYIDIADGNIIAGLLLSQIIYWHLPNKRGGTKLRVKKEGKLWLAKGRNDWWDECRINPRQFDKAISLLCDKGIIEKKVFQFKGTPVIHLHLKEEILMGFIENSIRESFRNHQSVNSISPNGDMDITKSVISYNTYTTTETTTETTIDVENQTSSNEDQKEASLKDSIKEISKEGVTEQSEDLVNYNLISHLSKESKRKSKLDERFKNKSIPDIVAWDRERVNKKENVLKGESRAKGSLKNSSVIITRFQELYNSYFSQTPPLVEMKHRKLVKTLVEHYGFEYTMTMLEEMFTSWSDFKRECKIKSTANLSLLYSFRDYFHERVRNKVTDGTKARDEF